eukprot:403350876
MREFYFTGEVKIHIRIKESDQQQTQSDQKSIYLHIDNTIQIQQVLIIENGSDQNQQIGLIHHDERYFDDIKIVRFKEDSKCFIAGREYTLLITYIGQIKTDSHQGVFCSVDKRILEKYNLTKTSEIKEVQDQQILDDIFENMQFCTHLEDKFARKLLPCFDEPMFKAKFQVNVVVEHNSHIAISNTIPSVQDNIDGTRFYIFEETPLMSTYLLSVTIGKFEINSIETNRGIQISTYLPYDLGQNSLDALKLAKDSLEFLESYFQIDYPLQKLDLIAFHEHCVRAMENWGCITFLLKILQHQPLTDVQGEDEENKQKVLDHIEEYKRNCKTIAHEVSHMWFGNLVTMKWWDDIWLNEGFARYMEHLVLEQIRPELDIWSFYMEIVYWQALNSDRILAHTHPVKIPIKGNETINDLFDNISYAKGSAIVGMIYGVIGDAKVFQDCLKEYLNRYKWRNASSDDLFQVMQEVSGKPIPEIFHKWIEQPCLPDLIITRISENAYSLVQRCHDDQKHSDFQDGLWLLPIHFKTTNGIQGHLMMDTKEMIFAINGLDSQNQTLFNYNAWSFHFNLYENREELLGLMEKKQIFDTRNQLMIKISYRFTKRYHDITLEKQKEEQLKRIEQDLQIQNQQQSNNDLQE